MNKTQLAEKQHGNQLKKDKREIKLNNKEHKKQNGKNRSEKIYKKYNHQLQKTK